MKPRLWEAALFCSKGAIGQGSGWIALIEGEIPRNKDMCALGAELFFCKSDEIS